MKSFISKLENDDYGVVGFDLDGTLYDEFDFVKQVYKPISHRISESLFAEEQVIYDQLCIEWLTYGSSANIFQNVIQKYIDSIDYELIKLCVQDYRNAVFHLKLTDRAIVTLDYLKNKNYGLFLITDGSSVLQRKKIEELELMNWFEMSNIAISGDYGSNTQKPNTYLAGTIEVLKNSNQKVLYVGDRICDHDFAHNCGFDFSYLKNMNMV